MNELPLFMFVEIFPYFFIAIMLGLAVSACRYVLFPRLKGRLGEAAVNRLIRRNLDPAAYRLIQDVTLSTPVGTTQIDHVIASQFGIFVLETKTFGGWVFGGEWDRRWTQTMHGSKTTFQNPLRQNYGHVKTLSELTGIAEAHFKSVIVFAGDCRLKTPMPPNVVYAKDLIAHIRSHPSPVFSAHQVVEFFNVIVAGTEAVSRDQKRCHVRNLRQRHQPASAKATAPGCPGCGNLMALRTNRKTGSQFWGCSTFPKCRGTRQVA